jgi:FixJ family two-component response regulator
MVDPRDHIVFVVDDDSRICEAIRSCLRASTCMPSRSRSAAGVPGHPKPDVPACLVLDVQLPDINGLDLQSPVRAGQLSADRVHHRPWRHSLDGASDQGGRSRLPDQAVRFRSPDAGDPRGPGAESRGPDKGGGSADLQQRLSSLTPREREVLPLIASGLLNKQAAVELGISEVTLQIHRGNIMKKMEAGSFADLVRMAAALELPITHSRHSRK